MVHDPVTNTMLLQHMQGMKYELQQQMKGLEQRIDGVENSLSQRICRLERRVEEGFQEAREHRQMLQEDLEATILLQGKQQKQIRRLERQQKSRA